MPLQGNRLLTSVGVGGLLPTWALLVTQNVAQPCGCAPERMPWGNSRPGALWHRAPGRTASESGRLRQGDGAHGRGDRAVGGPGPQGDPVQFPHSQCIPTSIPSEFPRIEVGGGHWDKTRWSRRFKRRLLVTQEAIAFCATRNLGPSLADVWERRDFQVSVEMLEDLHLGPLRILPYQLVQGFQLGSDPGRMYLGWWESSSMLDSLPLGP